MDSLLYYFCGFLFFLGVFFYLKNKKQYHLPDLFFGVFSLAVFISIFGKVQWISYAIGLFTIFALVIGVTEKKFKPYPVLLCFVGAYLVRIIGLSYTPDIKYGLYFLETDLSLLLFPCIVSCLVVRKAAINLLWRGDFLVFLFFITFCFISFTIGASSSEIGAYNLKNWYPYLFNWLSSQHPSYYAIMALFAIPVGWLLFYKPEQKIKSLTKVILFSSYIGVFILFSGARIAILSYPVVLLLCWIYFSRWKSRAFRVGLVVSVLLIGVVSILMLKPELKKRFIDTPRLQMWPTALHSIREHPLLGLGTG